MVLPQQPLQLAGGRGPPSLSAACTHVKPLSCYEKQAATAIRRRKHSQGRHREVPPVKHLVPKVQPFSEHTEVPRHMGKTGVQCYWLVMPASPRIHSPHRHASDAFYLCTRKQPLCGPRGSLRPASQEMLQKQGMNPDGKVPEPQT